MAAAREALLERVVSDVAANGLGDRSLRDLASSVGTSHRLLLYHFGSRPGLVAAIVGAIEASQQRVLAELTRDIDDPVEIVRVLWRRVSAREMLPFVRLFFETVGSRGESGPATEPWLAVSEQITARLGLRFDPVEIRLGVAVTRGLLVDVISTGDEAAASAALERFLELWSPTANRLPRL
ncbi:MAG: TetR/AcrR family transcriptional regulator [Ilumatobacteraceae bacterium]